MLRKVLPTPPAGKSLSTETERTVNGEAGRQTGSAPDGGSPTLRPPLLVSACLAGLRTRLDGSARPLPAVMSLAPRYGLIPVCHEQLGGLATPSPGAELCGGVGTTYDGTFSHTLQPGSGVAAALF